MSEDLRKQQEELEKEEDLFGQLFDEATEGKDESSADNEFDTQQDDTGTETEGTEESTGDSEEEQTEDKSEEEETTTEDEEESEGSEQPDESEESLEEDDEIDDPKVILQRYKTLQGMWRSEKEKRAQLEKRLEELESKLSGNIKEEMNKSTQEQNKSSGDDEDLARKLTQEEEEMVAKILAEDEKFNEIKEDFPEVAEALEHSLKKTLSQFSAKQTQQMMAILQQTVAPIIETQYQKTLEEHYTKVKAAHPDFERYLENGELEAWIEQQPPRKRKYLLEVYNEGSTEEVIELFDEFKEANGYLKKKPTPKSMSNNKTKLDDMEEPKARNRPVNATTKPSASADDYETAFEEALRQKS